MKKIVLSACLAVTCFFYSQAQVEITASYGYQFGTKLNYFGGYVKAQGSGQFGISAGMEFSPGMIAKLSYVSMGTELRGRDIEFTNNIEQVISDLQNDWFFLGVQRYFQDGPVKPFAGAGLGLVVVSPKNINRQEFPNLNLGSGTYFAFNFEAGVNFMFTDNIGLNVQGNLYLPINYGGFVVGTGGFGISTGSTQIVGGFSGGLVFRIDG